MMERLLRPAVVLMQRLDFKRRIWVIGGVFVLSLLVVAYQLDGYLRNEIWSTQQKLKGSELVKAVAPLLHYLSRHRNSLTEFLLGDLSAKAKVQQQQANIAETIKSVDAVMAKYGDEFKLKDKWEALKQEWQEIRSQAESLSLHENKERHEQLIAKVQAILFEISVAATLNLDRNTDTEAIAEILTEIYPSAREYIGRARTVGLNALKDGKLSDTEKADLKSIYEIASKEVEHLIEEVKTVMSHDPNLATRLESQAKDFEAKASSVLQLISELAQSSQVKVSPNDYSSTIVATNDALFELSKSLSNELESLYSARLRQLSNERFITLALIFALVALAFGLFAGFYLVMTEGLQKVISSAHKLSNEVFPEIVSALQQLSQGDLSYRISVTVPRVSVDSPNGTEEGQLLSSSAQLADSAQKMLDAFITSSQQLAQLISEVSEVANRLGEVSGQMAVATQQVGAAITQIANSVQQSAQGTTEQAASISRTQSAFEQLNKAIESIASGAQEQAKLVNDLASASDKIQQTLQSFTHVVASGISAASEAQQVANSNSQRLRQMLSSMEAIRNAVETARQQVEGMNKLMADIGKIVNTIADIAQQTNLLALNAAIEAARAGEQGRGFSVVADEVRKLAERSAQATKEIADLIANVQQGAEESVKAMDATYKQVAESAAAVGEAEQALGNIVDAVKKVQEQSNELEKARKEISVALEQVFGAIQRLSAIAEENAAATEELAATAADMSEQI
ncbi:MAG: methyl-accepting chemotaxis protein, partial [Armatimonadetes bacterium]|nr:methyl-accepting chemotaxis protein [Armatimonadota bacterium]